MSISLPRGMSTYSKGCQVQVLAQSLAFPVHPCLQQRYQKGKVLGLGLRNIPAVAHSKHITISHHRPQATDLGQ